MARCERGKGFKKKERKKKRCCKKKAACLNFFHFYSNVFFGFQGRGGPPWLNVIGKTYWHDRARAEREERMKEEARKIIARLFWSGSEANECEAEVGAADMAAPHWPAVLDVHRTRRRKPSMAGFFVVVEFEVPH